jgi:hypothetical protein
MKVITPTLGSGREARAQSGPIGTFKDILAGRTKAAGRPDVAGMPRVGEP